MFEKEAIQDRRLPMDDTVQNYGTFQCADEGYAGRIEVMTGPSGRRRWPEHVKAGIVLESYRDGVSVADVARRHGISGPQLHAWRRAARDAPAPSHPACSPAASSASTRARARPRAARARRAGSWRSGRASSPGSSRRRRRLGPGVWRAGGRLGRRSASARAPSLDGGAE